MKQFKISNVNPIQGIIILSVCIIFFLVLAAPLQRAWGMLGLAVTEIGLLVIGVLSALMFKDNLKTIFPIHKPKFHQVTGVLLIWLGSFILNIMIVLGIQFLFPGFTQVASNLNNFLSSTSMVLAIFIGAVMPAICEEIVHRGVILHTFKNIKNNWVTIFAVGVIFGVFHLSIYRFLPTAILGGFLTYIMINTSNILLPMLFHFVNNLVSVSSTFFAPSTDTTVVLSSRMQLASLGFAIILTSLVPVLLLKGSKLIKRDYLLNKKMGSVSTATKKKQRIIIIAASVMLIVIGGAVIGFNINTKAAFSIDEKLDVSIKNSETTFPFLISESRVYNIEVFMQSERGVSKVTIYNDDNNEVYTICAKGVTANKFQKLEIGTYTVVVKSYLENDEETFNNLGFTYDDELVKALNLSTDPSEVSSVEVRLKIE